MKKKAGKNGKKLRRIDLFEHGVEESGELLLERRHRRHGWERREEARATMKTTREGDDPRE